MLRDKLSFSTDEIDETPFDAVPPRCYVRMLPQPVVPWTLARLVQAAVEWLMRGSNPALSAKKGATGPRRL